MNQRITSTLGFAGSVVAATLAAAVITGQARAEGPIESFAPITGTLTRAQVQADLMQHRGEVTSYASEWTLQQHAPMATASTLTREEVRAAFIASRDEVRAMGGEDGGAGQLAAMRSRGFGSGTTVAAGTAR